MIIEQDNRISKKLNNGQLEDVSAVISQLKELITITDFNKQITAPILLNPIKQVKECYVFATVKNEMLDYISSCEQFQTNVFEELDINETPQETHVYYGKDCFYSLVYFYNQNNQNWEHPHISANFNESIKYCNENPIIRELMIAHWTQNTVLPTHTDGEEDGKNYGLIINLKGHGKIKILEDVISTENTDGFIFNATDYSHSAWNENVDPWEFLVVRLHPSLFE